MNASLTRLGLLAFVLHLSAVHAADGREDTILPEFEAMPQLVNGDPVNNGTYRFVTAILLHSTGTPSIADLHCGGSLVKARYVVTAAHCLVDDTGVPLSPSDLAVVTNMTSFGLNQGQSHAVRAFTLHPQYDHATYAYDVAVIELDSKVRNPAKLKLPQTGSDQSKYMATVAGWGSVVGYVKDQIPMPPSYNMPGLRQIELPIVTDQLCSDEYTQDNGPLYEPSTMLCAYTRGRGPCAGDDGGPLFRNVNGKMTLLGIVSFYHGCAQENAPGVYTRITNPEIKGFITGVIGQ